MTAGILPAPAAHQPAPPWTPAEHAARTDYLAAVQYAQQQYDADVQAATAAYHRAEQLAWYAYLMNTRAAAPPAAAPPQPQGTPTFTPKGRASCGHPADDDGECSCSSWPQHAPYSISGDDQ